jgi:hypothetical protein
MINKKNLLGREPEALGMKDAIHTAIVSVRAGKPIQPGQRCGMNADREAVPDSKGVGVADPFLKGRIATGQWFWLILAQDEIPTVAHVWEHPTVDFRPPSAEVRHNKYLHEIAEELGITYEQLMDSCAAAVETWRAVPFPGTKTEEECEAALDDRWNIFDEWAAETGHEFENEGSACCPETVIPDELFSFNGND